MLCFMKINNIITKCDAFKQNLTIPIPIPKNKTAYRYTYIAIISLIFGLPIYYAVLKVQLAVVAVVAKAGKRFAALLAGFVDFD